MLTFPKKKKYSIAMISSLCTSWFSSWLITADTFFPPRFLIGPTVFLHYSIRVNVMQINDIFHQEPIMSRFLIKPGLPFYLSGLAGKGDMFSSDYLCNLHTIVTIAHISSQFTHFCCDLWYFVSIYALMLQFLQVCRNLRTFVVVPENLRFTHLEAKKNCESWVPSQKNRISSHGPTSPCLCQVPRPWPLAGPQNSQFWPQTQGVQSQQEIRASYALTGHLCNSTNMCMASHHKRTAKNSAQGLCHCPSGSSSGREAGKQGKKSAPYPQYYQEQ